MEKVVSRDGTPIAYHRRGAGPPLVLVHGTGASNPIAWTGVLPTLEEHFTVYTMDRRGRGESGDSEPYSIEREYEDVAAIVDAAGGPANLLGHSYGALLALEAALLTKNVSKLILYEPYVPGPGVTPYVEGFIERLEALLAAGDREQVLTIHYREDVGMTPEQIEQMKSSSAWPARLASAHTLPREMRAEEQYTFDARRFKTLEIPTLLVTGSDSPQYLEPSTLLIHATLPNSRIVVMPGQEHIAMYTAPDLFLREVLAFLAGPEVE